MEELDHGPEFGAKWRTCEVWSCGRGGEGVEIPILKSFSWTLALRYLNPLRTFVSIITLISLVGVALGTMVLIVVLSIHNGFERNLKETLLGFSPHITVYSNLNGGLISDWEEMEKKLSNEPGVESAYALVEGFVLLDSKRWQRPVNFRAVNTDNEDQVEALRQMLDLKDYPESKIDFLYEGDKNVVISKQLAEGLGLRPGEEIRLIAASNLDAVMEVYNVPDQSAWELYSDVFEGFETDISKSFESAGEGEEKGSSEVILKIFQNLQNLVPVDIETPDGLVLTEGKEMRPVERRMIYGILDLLNETNRTDGGFDFYQEGTKDEILKRLGELKNLDLEHADNQGFRDIEEFVVPKTLLVQGVYTDNKRSQGPDLFFPLSIGMELKGLKGDVESIGLRIEDPYHAEQTAMALREALGSDCIVQSWMKTHSQQFQLVKTEKLMISFMLSFLTLLSAFSIMAVMYTVTVQKRQEIGVMKALGARPSQIVRVFLYQGLIVGIGGAVLGLGLGLLAIKYREGIMSVIRAFGVDPFPAEFHGMSELPALVVPGQLAVICAVAVVLCLLAALVPALLAAFRDPAKSLRNL
jgi:lipoprotein-releasing system permease protein